MPKIVGFQYDVAWEDRAANFERVRGLLGGAAGAVEPGSLLILPEMFSTGFSMNVEVTAEPEESSEALGFMRSLAAETRCAVLGGLVTPSESDCKMGRNELRVITPDGSQLARYQKNRTFRYTREFGYYERGTELAIFEWDGLRICPLICYDLRFPELFRRGTAQGAEAFIVIASWPEVRADHWVTLLRARAIENLAWVVGVNRIGPDPVWPNAGRSIVIDPHGKIVADAGAEAAGLLRADLDPEAVRSWRREFPTLMDMEL